MRYGIPPDAAPQVTIKVRMLRTTKATLDGGKTTTLYEEGRDYDLPEWLAEALFRGGEADPAEAHEQLVIIHNTGDPESPEEPGPTAAPRSRRRPSPGKSQA